jgi:cysteine desulfurase / selenocysteine lyase
MERRKFLFTSAGALGAAQLLPMQRVLAADTTHGALVPSTGPVAPDDLRLWRTVRAQFPLTDERVYLNTGGLGASPYAVIDAVKAKTDELEKICETGRSEALWKEIKSEGAALLGCDPDELAFTRNTTEAINIVAHGVNLVKGDEVILTTHEHVANAMTWVDLQLKDGIVIKRFTPSVDSNQANIDSLQQLITPRTRLISIPHVVTTTGLILPVKEIAAIARSKNIFFLVDGAQSAGMLDVNIHEIGCDAYATSGHKWLMAPKETGLLYVRKEMLEPVRARFIGAYSDNGFDFDKGKLVLHPSAQRYEYGTVSTPLRVGFGAAFKFIRTIGIGNISTYDRAMATALFEGLRKLKGVVMLSPADASLRSAMITIKHTACDNLALQTHLDTYKLRTRIVEEAGLKALRISLHCYNSFDDVGRILDAVRTVPS